MLYIVWSADTASGDGVGFTLKALGELLRADFDRDVAAQTR
jgi:hypothetical protein